MQIIYFSLAIALMWLHVAGLAAIVGPRFGSWAIGRAVAVVVIVMAGFCLEHMAGLGSLGFVWPFTALASLFYLWRNRDELISARFLRGELVFGCALAFGLLWRVLFPSIYQTSERLPDLVFISSLLSGPSLPSMDYWLPPFKFDYYYTLQYYGAALAGRLFQLSPGLTYNLSIVFLSGMSLALLWDLASRFVSAISPRVLLVAAVAFGGTGVSVLTHLIVESEPSVASRGERMWGSARFIGEYDQLINTDFGRTILPTTSGAGFRPRALGMENFGYQYFLGEFHAPLGGYFLLILVLALMAAMEAKADQAELRKRWLQGAMALSVPAVFATNTWMFPFHVALVGGWLLWRTWQGRRDVERRPDWLILFVVGAAGFILLYPFLSGFSLRTVSTPISMVQPADHTPLPHFLAVFWPLLILFGLGLWQRETRRLSFFLTILFGGLLLLSEFVYVNDPSGDHFERSNTVMKWWGWIWTGALAGLGAVLLAAPKRWVRIVTGLTLALTLVYAFDTANYWWHDHEKGGANLHGTHVYTSDPVTSAMFRYLAVAPHGIVLENQYETGYHEGGAFAAFSRKPLFVGWTNQLSNWHGNMELVHIRRAQVNKFYSGDMPNSRLWLLDNDIRYIVWTRRDTDPEGLWAKQNAELTPAYAWQDFSSNGGKPVGIWTRRVQK